MKKLRIKRGVIAATFPDIPTFMHAYVRTFGSPLVQCQMDESTGKLYSSVEIYSEIKRRFLSGGTTDRQWANSALRFFGL